MLRKEKLFVAEQDKGSEDTFIPDYSIFLIKSRPKVLKLKFLN
jgi:hypothetical protein